MANGKISIIDAEKAFAELKKLWDGLDGLEKKILSVSTATDKYAQSLSSIKGVADLAARLKVLEEGQEKVNKKMDESQKLTARKIALEAKLAAAESKVGREVSVLSKEYSNLVAQQKSVIKSAAQLAKEKKTEASAYLQLQAKLTALKTEYKNLAALQAQDVKLTTQQSAKLKLLTKDITAYDSKLKRIDAGMGVYTRSVGSYGKAFDSLGFSVAQLTRESPAFINSMQTGFMAISNNIPIFVDEINKLTAANAELHAAQKNGQRVGEKSVSVWKKVGSAVFGWQSLISAGIVLLTVFGPKLIKMAREVINGADALDMMADAQEDINKNMGQSVGEFVALTSVIQDNTKSEQDRLGALEELNSKYPDFNSKILDEKDNTDAVSQAIAGYIEKLGQKAKAQAAMGLLQEQYTRLIAQEQLVEEKRQQLEKESSRVRKSTGNAYTDMAYKNVGRMNAEKELNEELENSKDIQDEINKLLEIYVENVSFVTKSTRGRNEEETKYVTNSEAAFEKNIASLKKQMANIDITSDKYRFLRTMVQLLTDSYKVMKGEMEEDEDDEKTPFGSIKHLKEVYAENQRIIELTTDSKIREQKILENVEIQKQIELLKTLGKTIDDDIITKMKPARDVGGFEQAVLEISNFVDEYGEQIDQAIDTTNMFFDNRLERLQQDRDASAEYFDNLISLADGNEEEQKRLEEEKEARDKELREKQNKAAKKQAIMNRGLAIFSILLSSAEGIVAALSPVTGLGPVAGIPLAATIGALGLAQSVAVASAPLPKFKDGKDAFNNYEGLGIVNDGGKREFKEDKFGNISAFTGVNTVVPIAKDDIIHKDLESLSKAKGYDMDGIYQATILTSLANESKLSNVKLEKVFDKNLRNLNKDIKQGLRDGFKNVSLHSHTTVDLNHSMYKQDIL